MENNRLIAEFMDLERRVLRELSDKIEKSETKSLKVNLFDYKELVIRHDRLTFLDNDGLEYSLYSEATLEDLIGLIEEPITQEDIDRVRRECGGTIEDLSESLEWENMCAEFMEDDFVWDSEAEIWLTKNSNNPRDQKIIDYIINNNSTKHK